MKKYILILIAVVLIAAGVVIGMLFVEKTGISDFSIKKKNESISNDVACQVGDGTITKTELVTYYEAMKNQVEAIYTDKVWDVPISENGLSYAEALREGVLDKIIFIKLTCMKASAYGVELTPDDNITIDGYVKDFFASISEDTASKYNLTKEVVTNIYRDNVLCKKVYDKITLNAETDANEENCKQADFIRIRLNKYYEAADGEKKNLSDDEINKLKESLKTALKAKTAEDFYVIASRISVEDEQRITCGRDDIESEIRDKVFALTKDTNSGILETDESLYVYFCEEEKNVEATKKAIVEKTESDRKMYFTSLYAKWKDNTEIIINENVVNSLK